MKKRILAMITVTLLSVSMLIGCTSSPKPENEVIGTLVEVKDFMFVVTDEADTNYGFSFDEVPEGLDEVKIGDTILVKFTGTISEVDPFKGEVLSVEKQ